MTRTRIMQRRKEFRELHRAGCFVMPNPWDAGSAKLLASMGFKALATTSAGYAWSQGMADGQVGRAEMLAHMRAMVQAVDVPINADFERGFASCPDGLAESIQLAIETGIAGFSLEDSTGDPESPLLSVAAATARISQVRAVIDNSGQDVLLVGRAENFFIGNNDFDDVLVRLKAYAGAGADCLYAPGITNKEQISAIVSAVAPKPVNVLVGASCGLEVAELAALGVRRISVGGALARAAWAGVIRTARAMACQGRFEYPAAAPTGAELNLLFGGK